MLNIPHKNNFYDISLAEITFKSGSLECQELDNIIFDDLKMTRKEKKIFNITVKCYLVVVF